MNLWGTQTVSKYSKGEISKKGRKPLQKLLDKNIYGMFRKNKEASVFRLRGEIKETA